MLPLETRNTSRASLKNLETILRFIDNSRLKVSPKTGRPTAATSKLLSKLLYDGDWYDDINLDDDTKYIQSFAWPILIQAGKLARQDGNKLKLTTHHFSAQRFNSLLSSTNGHWVRDVLAYQMKWS